MRRAAAMSSVSWGDKGKRKLDLERRDGRGLEAGAILDEEGMLEIVLRRNSKRLELALDAITFSGCFVGIVPTKS